MASISNNTQRPHSVSTPITPRGGAQILRGWEFFLDSCGSIQSNIAVAIPVSHLRRGDLPPHRIESIEEATIEKIGYELVKAQHNLEEQRRKWCEIVVPKRGSRKGRQSQKSVQQSNTEAKKGSPNPQYSLGSAYLKKSEDKESGEQAVKEAVKWFNKAAFKCKEASFALGILAEQGLGGLKPDQAAKWFKESARQGIFRENEHPKIAPPIGMGAARPHVGIEPTPYFLLAKSLGCEIDPYYSGHFYLRQQNPESDIKAVECFKKAAPQKKEALFYLGLLANNGQGGLKRYEAAYWFKQAAQQAMSP